MFAGFSAEALAERIVDAKSKVLITADEFRRGGKVVPLKSIVDDALQVFHSFVLRSNLDKTGYIYIYSVAHRLRIAMLCVVHRITVRTAFWISMRARSNLAQHAQTTVAMKEGRDHWLGDAMSVSFLSPFCCMYPCESNRFV